MSTRADSIFEGGLLRPLEQLELEERASLIDRGRLRR